MSFLEAALLTPVVPNNDPVSFGASRRSSGESRLTDIVVLVRFVGEREGMGAAGVCPHVGESDLLVRALLEEEFAGNRMKEKDGECSMQGRFQLFSFRR